MALKIHATDADGHYRGWVAESQVGRDSIHAIAHDVPAETRGWLANRAPGLDAANRDNVLAIGRWSSGASRPGQSSDGDQLNVDPGGLCQVPEVAGV